GRWGRGRARCRRSRRLFRAGCPGQTGQNGQCEPFCVACGHAIVCFLGAASPWDKAPDRGITPLVNPRGRRRALTGATFPSESIVGRNNRRKQRLGGGLGVKGARKNCSSQGGGRELRKQAETAANKTSKLAVKTA